jgi:glycosyltransferase involved in cell wall biosynthesis
MKILTDLQACQSLPHKDRGIGRYALALAAEMSRLRGEHAFRVALNAVIPDTIEAVRAAMPAGTEFAVWSGIERTAWERPGNELRRAAAGIVRDAALAATATDIHHISSFFEGYADDVVVDIAQARRVPVAVTLYDLIPLLYQDLYLANARMKGWYLDRIETLKRADLLLTISECTRRDAIEHLGMDPSRIVNISAAVDPMFRRHRLQPDVEAALRARFGLNGRILLYTGGIDHRKNIGRLIEAFARVEPSVRAGVQLVIVCGIGGESAQLLRAQAAAAGLGPGDLVLTGYVSDKDLVALYNVCQAFVFPSWYEGFGLPVLEAMACGAAVIASDRASVPEVVGRSDALFDPFSIDEMAARITQVLADGGFCSSLREHALTQSRRFSWEGSATRAIEAMAEAVGRTASSKSVAVGGIAESKPTLAFVAPLPPEQTGIANYCSELLPHLAEHYRIVLISDQARVEPAPGWSMLETRDVAWFEQHVGSFDRILYHFGNSAFHGHMFGLLERFGGVAVLHDFYLSGIVSHLQWASKIPGFWVEYLYRSHGYGALVDLASGVDPEEMLLRYPCNAPVIDNADGVIVHSQHSRELARAFYGDDVARDWSVVPLLKTLPEQLQRSRSRSELGIAADDFVICSFGILGDGKLNHRLLEAWQASSLSANSNCRLVFVGGAHDPAFDAALRDQIASGPGSDRVTITGYASSDDYNRYLQAADVAVQLRRHSRGETSAALFDCLAHGIPTIVNAHGSMAELQPESAVVLQDDFDSADLTRALENLHAVPQERVRLAEAGVRYCRENLDPGNIAGKYRHAIERAYLNSPTQRVREAGVRLSRTWDVVSENDRALIAEAMAANLPVQTGVRQMLVDVTELTRRDARSGIQRVVRSIVSALTKAQPAGYRVEPVYADADGGYRYAREFCSNFFQLGALALADEPIAIREGDVFIGLDLALEEIPANVGPLQHMRDLGAHVYVVVYDLLPLVRNDCFPAHAEPLYRNWLTSLSTVADGAICISRAVADDLVRELDGLGVERSRPLQVGFFHLGGDIEESLPTRGMTKLERMTIDRLAGAPSFLMVGTIEPRKGHLQSLDAFELLWAQGGKQQLVIVGKPGWMTDSLMARIRSHPELDKRLFWFEGAGDEVLEVLYRQCSVLLAASEGEGFGLPLIEAARHGLPILARDLPVFREVATTHALYFEGYEASDLAEAVKHWCQLDAQGQAPGSSALRWVTWKQSAEMLVGAAVGGEPYARWLPSARRYLAMHDTRHEVVAGSRARGAIILPQQPGAVVHTHPVALPADRYRLSLHGVMHGPGSLQVDVGGEVFAANLGSGETRNEAVCTAVNGGPLFQSTSDDRGLSVTIRCDGRVRGTITALVFEPVAPTHEDDVIDGQENHASGLLQRHIG